MTRGQSLVIENKSIELQTNYISQCHVHVQECKLGERASVELSDFGTP